MTAKQLELEHPMARHGTRSRYRKGCREECCRAAERAYRRRYRAERAVEPVRAYRRLAA